MLEEDYSQPSSSDACKALSALNNSHSPIVSMEISNMREEDRIALHGRILADFECITNRFLSLNEHIIQSLNSRNITPQKIAKLLSELSATLLDSCDSQERVPLLKPCLDSITTAKDVEDAFNKFHPFQSFFDCHLTRHIVMSNLCTPEDKKKFEEYSTEFDMYCKRRVCECPEQTHFIDTKLEQPKKFQLLETTIDVKNYTLGQLNELCGKVASAFSLERHTLCLHSIRDPNHLIFQIPSFIMEEVFPLFQKRHEELKHLLIHEIKCKADTLFTLTSQSSVYNLHG